MLRIRKKKSSKKAITLVELVVAMTLTALFAASCVMLILPIERIYIHMRDLSRAQVLSDTVVDALRRECSGTYITDAGDVWIIPASSGYSGLVFDGSNLLPSDYSGPGDALVVRKTVGFCETISSGYAITSDFYEKVKSAESETGSTPELDQSGSGAVTSRAVYRMFAGGSTAIDLNAGYIHFGYFNGIKASEAAGNVFYPSAYYDFTNPFSSAAYGDFTVKLEFSDIGYDTDGLPRYVNCLVSILNSSKEVVYTRQTVLCFS